jgi:hypothetical protein
VIRATISPSGSDILIEDQPLRSGTASVTMADVWFPVGTNDTSGWRLDIVSLLAVIGESSMAEHAQAMTASWLCVLPRIIPAPQVLLKPTRPTRMPQVNAAVVGVMNGTFVQTLNYFPNILHPIEELPAFAFRVYAIKHSPKRVNSIKPNARGGNSGVNGGHSNGLPMPVISSSSSSVAPQSGIKKRGTVQSITQAVRVVTHSNEDKLRPHVPARMTSPLNILSIFSFALTLGLFALSVVNKDGVACISLVTISLASSIVGYASMWSPQLMKRTATSDVPQGDVVIRTREGAFIVVKCDENVARELYTGTEECVYTVQSVQEYRTLVGIGTFLLMVSVVLLGNCNFPQQLAIGASYIVLNGLFWGAALIPKEKFWDLTLYEFDDITPEDGKHAHLETVPNSADPEHQPSFTRTMWYAIRETEEIGWVKKSGAAPVTEEWDAWLKEAETSVKMKDRKWRAVTAKDRMIGQTETTPSSPAASAMMNGINVPGGQHAPLIEILPDNRR